MGTLLRKIKYILKPVLPYGVVESWENLDPRLYHAIHIYWLKFYGLWYNGFSPKSFMYWLQMLYAMVVLWLVCFLPGYGEAMYLFKRRDNIGNIAEGLYLFLSEMYTYFKLAAFWLKKSEILSLLERLHCSQFQPREREHRDLLRRRVRAARQVMTSYTAMCVGAVTVAIVMPFAERFEVLPTNVEYPMFDVHRSPIYEILYVHHVYYKPATCIIDGVMDTILAAFIASVIGQIDMLAFNLRNFDLVAARRQSRAGENTYYTREYYIGTVLRDCIKHHNCIIRYVHMIEDAFGLTSMLQFMLSAMVICLVGVQFLSIERPASHPFQIMWMAIYLTCMLIEFFILCWFGNELIWKSEQLRQAAFEGPWLKTSERNKKYIVILMERCKRPLKVTAGKIFTLSLDTYTILINWSYKAFAVMRNMKN